MSVGEASHATVSPTLHYMMGIAFGHSIYSLLYHFINADWNDRFSQFLTNRQTWQGLTRLVVYASALVSFGVDASYKKYDKAWTGLQDLLSLKTEDQQFD